VSAISRHHSEQPNAATQAIFTDQWTRLLLAYARHRGLFVLRIEDAEVSGGEWDEVLRNPRINRASSVLLVVSSPSALLAHPGDLSFDLLLLSVAVKSNIVCDAPQGD